MRAHECSLRCQVSRTSSPSQPNAVSSLPCLAHTTPRIEYDVAARDAERRGMLVLHKAMEATELPLGKGALRARTLFLFGLFMHASRPHAPVSFPSRRL